LGSRITHQPIVASKLHHSCTVSAPIFDFTFHYPLPCNNLILTSSKMVQFLIDIAQIGTDVQTVMQPARTTVAPTGSRLYRRLATGGPSVGGWTSLRRLPIGAARRTLAAVSNRALPAVTQRSPMVTNGRLR
jgi:hypothetical protein